MRKPLTLLALVLALGGCQKSAPDVEWQSHSGPDAQRYSTLADIDRGNVGRLGLAFAHDLETDRGQEATPIMVGGVLYVVSAYDVVEALDARDGHRLWRYDPDVRAATARGCCGPVSRGVAVADGKVYLGAIDGRLIALDARSGQVLWQTQTVDQADPLAVNYTITGAPRVVKDMVLIGNGGAEFGARGYVSAYDRSSGRLRWRFYTVPPKPGRVDHAASDPVMARAAQTWAGQWWRYGGGGTVWDAIEYDPKSDLIYIGTGNGSPWNHGMRSAGQGDNLFLSSIVALRADTGRYVWHYQEVPGDSWDYTATQNMVMARLTINGTPRDVLMQAPKNGYFYVLDRRTGQFLSGKPFMPMNWSRGIDPHSGRPDIDPQARYYQTGQARFQFPSSGGAHNWPPMAFSPQTGLVYIPAQDVGMVYAPANAEKQVVGAYTSGVAMAGGGHMDAAATRALYSGMKGYLIAWDPVAQRERWRVKQVAPFNGGVLATGGHLVFAGNTAGQLQAFDDTTGRVLWSFPAQTGVLAPPITYRLQGTQYVAVMAGWGGGWPLTGGVMALQAGKTIGPNRLLVFALDGKAKLPPLVAPSGPPPRAIIDVAPAINAQYARGDGLYGRFCLRCHGAGAVSAGAYPDLRQSPLVMSDAFPQIVLNGALAPRGMPSFAGQLTRADLDAIRIYLARRSYEDLAGAPQK
ncbi:PQQ-dependent dehydrogenase, methanol/ethanol family [Novosphingobium sp. FSY-8]|uniref:PQQ-dependent dehydrogenase, methanol/ethanol family n=1 Tax=Novosphingobium ovatum TaxID=1908523 RepID=A0ABW9XFW4_9SPHN|nr:PQQ-dependent dehydrogenase, methanol/ethanol family [Novosphingobium ovatum]NBC37430.1 PQQ-dependent dehydrogenase, methanol/ethanol family [Novosphingobium ovatum]